MLPIGTVPIVLRTSDIALGPGVECRNLIMDVGAMEDGTMGS